MSYLLIVCRFWDYMLIGFVCARLLKVKFKLLWTACLHVYTRTSLCTSALPLLCCSAVVPREVVVEAIHIFLTVCVYSFILILNSFTSILNLFTGTLEFLHWFRSFCSLVSLTGLTQFFLWYP